MNKKKLTDPAAFITVVCLPHAQSRSCSLFVFLVTGLGCSQLRYAGCALASSLGCYVQMWFLLGRVTAGTHVHVHNVARDTGEGETTSRLRSVTLMCPAGINPPEATDEQREEFHCSFLFFGAESDVDLELCARITWSYDE